jgi:signal transduction histidine kinase
VVDDEDGPRQSLQVIFKDEYEILMAGDGPTAIDLAQKNRVDVAVLDIRMAGMSGIEVLERLKYVDPAIEAVMMTAFETTETMRQALRLRACDYINKPFDISTMRAAVGAAMQRRLLESEIRNNADQLQQLIAELQDQKIEQRMSQTRGEIYASVIHDINGPLTVISGFAQLMDQRIGDVATLQEQVKRITATVPEIGRVLEDLEFVKERLKTIIRQAANCSEITRRYLGLMRHQSDNAPPTSVNLLLTDFNHLVRVHPSLHNNQFTLYELAEDVAVRMHGTDLIQALLNLTVNALQCTTQVHSVVVEARLLPEALDLVSFKDGPEERFLNMENLENRSPLLCFSVSDNGPGIPAELLPKIFQPFFTTKTARQGTGLGLNIVQRLIKEAKGALHVHTCLGKGTAFTMYLPAVRG